MKHHGKILAAVAALILTLTPAALANVGSGGMGARSYTDTDSGDVFLGGDYIEIGISKTGSFGTENAAPTTGAIRFHPHGGDVRNTTVGAIGLRANGQGWETDGVQKPDETKDFFLPGRIDEGFLIGWSDRPERSASVRGVGSQIGEAGNSYIYNENTVDKSTPELLKATSTGLVNGVVEYTQVVSFKPSDKQFLTEITLKNTSASPLYDLTYVRRFDPDQNPGLYNEVTAPGTYLTDNFFIKDEGGIAWTIACINPLTSDGKGELCSIDQRTALDKAQNVFCFYANDLRAESVYGDIDFRSFDDMEVGDKIYGTHIWADQAIGHETKLGTLAAGESVTFSYYSSLDPDIGGAISKAEDVTVVVTLQPVSRTFAVGAIDGTLRVMGEKLIEGKAYHELSYQWYQGDGMTAGGGTPVAGAASWDYAIPATLDVGTYYYYCVVTDPASGKSAVSNAARINVVLAGSAIHSVGFHQNKSGATAAGMPSKQTVADGQTLLDLGSPSMPGYGFTGWFTEAAMTNRWDFTTPVTSSFTLYAGWTNAFTANNPKNVTAVAAQDAVFETSGPSGAAYQWQRYQDGHWVDIPGATSASAVISGVTSADSGAVFRCAVTYNGTTIYTASATLTVLATGFSISRPPEDQRVALGAQAAFSVSLTGAVAPSYQWQCDEGDGVWRSVAGATGPTLNVAADSLALSGRRFRCRVTDQGVEAISAAAVLTVYDPIVPQPGGSVTPPQTGDGSMPQLWLGLMLASALGLTVCAARRARARKS